MPSNIIARSAPPIFLTHPVWWAVVNLLITLYGVLFKDWNLQPIVFIFWMEIIFSVAAALIRVIGAMNNQPFLAGLGHKIFALIFGAVMGIGFIMLTVTFTFKVFDDGMDVSGFEGIRIQMFLLGLNYLAALVLHYFLNGRYRSANPIGELMSTFVYLLVLLCFIMVITMHLIPKFPQLDQPLWVGLAVVGVKFGLDLIFMGVRKTQVMAQVRKGSRTE